MPSAAQLQAEELVEFVDRQFAYVHDNEFESGDSVLRWVTVLARLEADPRIRGILGDLDRDAEEALSRFNAHAAGMRRVLAALWQKHRRSLEHAKNHQQFEKAIFGSLGNYGKRLRSRPLVSMPNAPRENKDPSDLVKDLLALEHWQSLASGAAAADPTETARLDELAQELRQLRQRHTFELRRFHTVIRTTAGPALHRLRRLASATNPAPEGEDDDSVVRRVIDEPLAKALHTPEEAAARDQTIREAKAALIRDGRALQYELRARVGATRSKLGLLERFIAKCQTYDSARLRKLIAIERRKTRPAVEGVLTLELARFLFEQGLNPLVDPKIAGLRPDIFENAAMDYSLYVEAKQYDGRRSPRAQIISAVRQVFDTWARLRVQYPVREAFLVIFRVGGSLAIIDPHVEGPFGTLYLHVADIARTPTVGSRQRSHPIGIAASELAPAPAPQKITLQRERPRRA